MSVSSEIKKLTKQRIEQLYRSAATGAGRGRLAEIRRGVGKKPGELPSTWGLLFQGLPVEMYSVSGEPSRAEWAIYTALTLYALHQQGAERSMNCEGESLGKAIGRLCRNSEGRYTDEDRERIERRFMPLATASNMSELVYHLRSMVQLLKAEGIPLDYPALAYDIYRYQNENYANSVRLRWGQDFYRKYDKDNEENTNEN